MPLSKSAATAAVVAVPVVFCLGLALLALRLFARTVIFPGCADPFPSGPELVRRIRSIRDSGITARSSSRSPCR